MALYQELWNLALYDLEVVCGEAVINSWIAKLTPVSFDDGVFCLSCATDFICDNVRNRYGKEILSSLQAHNESVREVSFIVSYKSKQN